MASQFVGEAQDCCASFKLFVMRNMYLFRATNVSQTCASMVFGLKSVVDQHAELILKAFMDGEQYSVTHKGHKVIFALDDSAKYAVNIAFARIVAQRRNSIDVDRFADQLDLNDAQKNPKKSKQPAKVVKTKLPIPAPPKKQPAKNRPPPPPPRQDDAIDSDAIDSTEEGGIIPNQQQQPPPPPLPQQQQQPVRRNVSLLQGHFRAHRSEALWSDYIGQKVVTNDINTCLNECQEKVDSLIKNEEDLSIHSILNVKRDVLVMDFLCKEWFGSEKCYSLLCNKIAAMLTQNKWWMDLKESKRAIVGAVCSHIFFGVSVMFIANISAKGDVNSVIKEILPAISN